MSQRILLIVRSIYRNKLDNCNMNPPLGYTIQVDLIYQLSMKLIDKLSKNSQYYNY